MKEEMKSTQTIEIPEGTFEGNCSDCVYADWNDTDRYGRVYCRGSYGGYNNPSDRNGCFYYKNVEKMDCTCYRLCCGLVTIMCWKYNIYH